MTGFYSEYRAALNDKGRFNVPKAFRENLGESFFAVRAFRERCLLLYTADGLEELRRNTDTITNTRLRDLHKRTVLSSVTELTADEQGRVVLPAVLREYACLKKEICVKGMGERVELWDEEVFDIYFNDELSKYTSDELDKYDLI
ncbi:MAG: hypothetical protein LBN40_04985 [Oscillospiraceae bacterium]|jgi:MraZ protein|nr:hypothetical protein [Oscillospiraceae bacterium]